MVSIDRVRAELTPTGTDWDASLYLVTSCNDIAQSCVAGEDNGEPEIINYTAVAAGDYFLIVDGYRSNAGTYDLLIELNPTPILNDRSIFWASARTSSIDLAVRHVE